MSGIEVAGLVMAAFPLVIAGLKSYSEGVENIKSWRRYRRQLNDYQEQLETQQTCFLNTMTHVLDGIVATDLEMNALIEDPGGPAWKINKYDLKLQIRLDHTYAAYFKSVTQLRLVLHTLKEKLGIEDSGRLKWDRESTLSIRKEVEKLKLVLEKTTYEHLLAKVDKLNGNLYRLTRQNQLLESGRRQRRPGGTRCHLRRYKMSRLSASKLHDVMIRGGKAWKCLCQHSVNIRLEPATWSQEDKENNDDTKLRFRMLLCCGDHLDHIHNSNGNGRGKSLSSKWAEFDIEPWEDTDCRSPTVSDRGGSHYTTRKDRVVSFALGDSNNVSRRLPSPSAVYPTITDLCSALHLCTERKCVGVLLDQYSHEHQVFALGSREILDRPSLETVLTCWAKKPKRRRGGFQFGYRQRLFIAASLASGILRLGESWLKSNWSSHDIYLIPPVETGSGGTVGEDELYHPYFSWETLEAQAGATLDNQGKRHHAQKEDSQPHKAYAASLSSFPRRPIHRDFLFPLGLTLLELSLGTPWSVLEVEEQLDSEDVDDNIETALGFVYKESSGRFGDVVRRCLYFEGFDSRNPGLDNDDFQEAILDKIVKPLIADWMDFDGRNRIP